MEQLLHLTKSLAVSKLILAFHILGETPDDSDQIETFWSLLQTFQRLASEEDALSTICGANDLLRTLHQVTKSNEDEPYTSGANDLQEEKSTFVTTLLSSLCFDSHPKEARTSVFPHSPEANSPCLVSPISSDNASPLTSSPLSPPTSSPPPPLPPPPLSLPLPSSPTPPPVLICEEEGRDETIREPPSKKYRCKECGARFSTNFNLKRHTKKHLGIYSYVCDWRNSPNSEVCGQKFYEKQDFQRHTRLHTGEKPFQCEMCPKRFATRSYLKKHCLGMHPEEQIRTRLQKKRKEPS